MRGTREEQVERDRRSDDQQPVRRRAKGGIVLKRARPADMELDAKVRLVVIEAKRAGTLGAGSPWRGLDPMDDETWSAAQTPPYAPDRRYPDEAPERGGARSAEGRGAPTPSDSEA